MNNSFIQSIKNKGGYKTQSNNGGGKSSCTIGLWQDGQGKQKHIKTKALGIGDGQGFIINIIKDKIQLMTFTSQEVDELKKNGVNVFKSCSKGVDVNGRKKYQSYTVVEGIDDTTWDKMVELNGGVKRYNKNSKEGQEVLRHYEVVAYKQEEVATSKA